MAFHTLRFRVWFSVASFGCTVLLFIQEHAGTCYFCGLGGVYHSAATAGTSCLGRGWAMYGYVTWRLSYPEEGIQALYG